MRAERGGAERESLMVLVYDLPSENQVRIRDNGLRNLVRNLRIRCVRALHSLGLMCTESVVIIAPNQTCKVDEIINWVIECYREFESRHNVELGRPIIRALPLTEQQQSAFLQLARRRIQERLDECIDRVSLVIERIDEIITSGRAESAMRGLLRLRREWNTIHDFAERLGIEIPDDFDYLMDLIDGCVSRIRRER